MRLGCALESKVGIGLEASGIAVFMAHFRGAEEACDKNPQPCPWREVPGIKISRIISYISKLPMVLPVYKPYSR